MKCPFCQKPLTAVTNSRTTKQASQIWRRRKCLNCKQTFTTHELVDLSHIIVVKKSGKTERFSRIKLYSGIYIASIGFKANKRELFFDQLTVLIEKEILSLHKKRIESQEILDIILRNLRHFHTQTFIRYLTYSKNINNESDLKKELKKYMS